MSAVTRRPLRCAVLLILLAAALCAVLPGTASAHAVLEQTTPVSGAVLAQAPDRVLLRFGEAVTVETDGVKVYDDHLRRVDVGGSEHLSGSPDTIGVRLENSLADGTYTATWRVVSADSHPVSGGLTFSVGHADAGTPAVPSAGSGAGPDAQFMAGARWLGYVGAVLGLGVASILLMLWPNGRTDRRSRRIVGAGWALLVVGALAELLVQGPYSAGEPIGGAFDPGLLADTAATPFGTALLFRLGLLILLVPLLVGALRADSAVQRTAAVTATAVGLGILMTMSVTGHASAGALVPLALTADVVHLAAMSFWLGGLAVLSACLLSRHRAAELATVAPRFSRLAMICVAALVVTGGYQSWRNVRHPAALIETTYGRLLLAKTAVFVLILVLANLARRRVAGHARPGDAAPATQIAALRRTVAGEALIGVIVLAVTAALVGTAQAKDTYSPTYSTEQTTNGQRLRVTATPARLGATEISVQLAFTDGVPIPVQHIDGSLTLPSRQVGPLPVTFDQNGNGGVAHTQFPAAGDWQLDLTVQTSPISAITYQITVPVT